MVREHLIAYPLSLRDVYNLKQIERLLTEQRIDFTAEKGKIAIIGLK